ncbi:MAG: hypothetical protein M3Q08_08300, partial [Pseudomonadota bacterium]|nr:hypothetical protein [Pseudomonadota bacterium]
MRQFPPHFERALSGFGVPAGALRTARAGLLHAAEANLLLTRTFEAPALSAAPLSIFERAGRILSGPAARVW